MSAAVTTQWPEVVEADTYPRGLPPWTYNNAAITKLEHQRVLLPSWQIVCHINDIRDPGDVRHLRSRRRKASSPLRDREGAIRAYHNFCRHRAARLLEEATAPAATPSPAPITAGPTTWTARCVARQCVNPFRAWIAASTACCRCAWKSWPALYFVSLTGDGPPPSAMWGDMLEDFTPYHFEQMQPLAPMYYEDWDVDWKVAMDNYLESYHVPIGHPGLSRMFTPDYDDQLNLAHRCGAAAWAGCAKRHPRNGRSGATRRLCRA